MRTLGIVLALVAGLLPAACGGGGTDNTPAPAALFQVTQVVPPNNAGNVPLTQELNIVFSRPVDAASLDVDSLQVVADSGDGILGDRLVAPLNRAVVRFLPRNGYLPFAVHTIRVTTKVLDEDGRPLDREYVFRFQAEEEGPILPTQAQVEDRGAMLVFGRWFHRMTLLPSNRFLVAGGYTADNATLAEAENLIPGLGDSFLIRDGPLAPRAAHVQLLLHDGRVLLAGGESGDNPFVPLLSCEVFDPVAFRFEPAAPMKAARSFAHGAVLEDGRVLVTGGQGYDAGGNFIFRDDAEIYDPVADDWTLLPARMASGRSGHFSLALPGGDLLVMGGTPSQPSAERWSAASGGFSDLVGPPHAHFLGAATVLPDGRPLVVSGSGSRAMTIWDPSFGFLGGLNSIVSERVFATATAFADGRTLVIGGINPQSSPAIIHDTVDLIFPVGHTGKAFRVPNLRLPKPTSHHEAGLGPDGSIWITGGLPANLADGALRQVTVIHPK